MYSNHDIVVTSMIVSPGCSLLVPNQAPARTAYSEHDGTEQNVDIALTGIVRQGLHHST